MIKLKYGNTNTYFCEGLLVDTDMAGTMPSFFKEIKRNGIKADDVRYVLATHYHPDHIGLIGELMTYGVELVILEKQLGYVHFSDELFFRQRNLDYKPIDEKKAKVISIDGSREFLSSIGIGGEIVPTESHSEDGIALMLDDGHCFVGDLEPMQYIDAYGNDSALKKDWERILKYSPSVIHYGHANDQFTKK